MISRNTPALLTAFVHEHIPLTRAMGLEITALTDEMVEATVPFEGNQNHNHVIFGGSMASASVVAAWAVAQVRLDALAPFTVVGKSCEFTFLNPIRGAYSVRAVVPASWPEVQAKAISTGRAKCVVNVDILADGVTCGKAEVHLVMRAE